MDIDIRIGYDAVNDTQFAVFTIDGESHLASAQTGSFLPEEIGHMATTLLKRHLKDKRNG